MTNPFQAAPWQSVLKICDRLGSLRTRLLETGEGHGESGRILAETRKTVQQLRDCIERESLVDHLLSSSDPPGFEHDHAIIIALLTQQYLSGKARWIRGREIVQLLYPSSFERLKGLAILHPDGVLRQSGVLDVETTEGGSNTDPLETYYRLSDDMVRRISGWPEPAEPTPKVNAPANARQVLMRFKELLELSSQRVRRLFDPEEPPVDGPERREIEQLTTRIERDAKTLRTQLDEAGPQARSGLIDLADDFGLSWEETLIVACLYLSEIFRGEAFLPTISLVRMFCTSEEDLLRHQNLFHPDSALVKSDVVQLEEMIEGRSLSAEVTLSNWVVERLTQCLGRFEIQQDEQIDFHLYLRELENYEDFLRDLGGLEEDGAD
ncbi:MAG: hypothetical protein H6834_13035 [Planctomycetes bacterium]|nr:hypothetical protein [Planctomycetota bacterium]